MRKGLQREGKIINDEASRVGRDRDWQKGWIPFCGWTHQTRLIIVFALDKVRQLRFFQTIWSEKRCRRLICFHIHSNGDYNFHNNRIEKIRNWSCQKHLKDFQQENYVHKTEEKMENWFSLLRSLRFHFTPLAIHSQFSQSTFKSFAQKRWRTSLYRKFSIFHFLESFLDSND